jgi:hypothetical protein
MIKRPSVLGRYSLFALGLTVCFIGVVLARSIRAWRVQQRHSDAPGVSVDAGSGAQNVIILGTAIRLSPPSLTFGSSPQRVTVTNGGTSTLHLYQIAIVGANAGDFSKTTTCGSTLAFGASCTVSVTFTPKATGMRTASLLFSDDARGSPQAVGLTGTGQFMTLSADKTYLVNTFTNKPVFITGDTGFSLVGQLSNADIETYFSDRAARGFNLIWIGAVDNTYCNNPPYNALGEAPFGAAPFTQMQEPFFDHLDYILQRAAAYGITVLLGPAFSGYSCSDSYGWCPELEAASDATLIAYGTYLGNRYKSYPNIIWLIGGDMNVAAEGSIIQTRNNDIAVGIASVDTAHLMTAEAVRNADAPGISALQQWAGYSWLSLNSLYDHLAYFAADAAANYQLTCSGCGSTFIPAFELEGEYEGANGSGTSEQDLRAQAYWGILSGAYLGFMFGNIPIESFNSTGGGCTICAAPPTWQSQLGIAGSVSASWTGALFRSREHWKMVPDLAHTVVTSGYGSGLTLTVTSRTGDGQTIIAYIPNGNATTITVDMTEITSASNTAQCWWFNPSSGATISIGSYANSGTQDFTPPDSNDWVLVIDDADANLPAPGSANL